MNFRGNALSWIVNAIACCLLAHAGACFAQTTGDALSEADILRALQLGVSFR